MDYGKLDLVNVNIYKTYDTNTTKHYIWRLNTLFYSTELFIQGVDKLTPIIKIRLIAN